MAILHYIQALKDTARVDSLQSKMAHYYQTTNTYYEDINFTHSNWARDCEVGYQRILDVCRGKKVAEVGCGSASILATLGANDLDYTGCDFSEALMVENRQKYPSANFEVIKSASTLPIQTEAYDVVFCVFVLEHVVRPKRFLEEIFRCCKRGGKVIVFCPDYAGRLGIASQIVGFSNGSGVEKICRGRVFDGLITGFIYKVLMPVYFRWKLRSASQTPVFLLNERPACFYRPFYPDADAVYVTHQGEILKTLNDLGSTAIQNLAPMQEYNKQTRTLFIEIVRD